MEKDILWLDEIELKNINQVGGKNASLGEMICRLTQKGIQVPMGFATTASAYQRFLRDNQLEEKIYSLLAKLDVTDIQALKKTGQKIRRWITQGHFSNNFKKSVENAYNKLKHDSKTRDFSVAVRSSATAEDLPTASFAGQQETVLNVKGLQALYRALKKVFASLYTNRAIAYRVHHGFEHQKVALSVCIQYMVRSDIGSSGVAFSIDTESGFNNAILVTASYGLGETIVKGSVNPDEYYLFKPAIRSKKHSILQRKCGEKAIKMIYDNRIQFPRNSTKVVKVSPNERNRFVLTNEELRELGLATLTIEEHYKKPMDIEWAKDGKTNEIYIVQARPETVKSHLKAHQIEQYKLKKKGKVIVEGVSVGQKIGKGKATILKSASEINKLKQGEVLVTDMTDPDWEPIMKKSSAIVTNRGGRTCHAAIVARELGIPAIVGCRDATKRIKNKQPITVSCAEGHKGFVYDGLLDFSVEKNNCDKMPKIPTKIMMNVANPYQAFEQSFLPNAGVGLARLEFIITNIGIHPKAVLNYKRLPSGLKNKIRKKMIGYQDPKQFYVDKLREGISMIAAAFYPKPVIVRTSDFKSNEYANLLGGKLYEPTEENPMLGFRGASRYVDERFEDCFELECLALKQVRDEMGLTNVEVMIPFTRTVDEAKAVLKVLANNGLKRGKNKLKIIMMCEIPSNAVLAEEFLEHFDGFSIGSNDLTQLTLGLDRDSNIIQHLFDERNEAVKFFLSKAIKACNKLKKYIGICGQGPSDYPDLAQWLVNEKIGSMSLNPDSVITTWLAISKDKK